MSRFLIRTAAALLALPLLVACAAAQESMRVYVARDALDAQTAQLLVQRLEMAMPQADWHLEPETDGGADLRTQVMGDRAPDIALCAPGEALPWAQEGMLLPLQGVISEQGRIQEQVLSSCVLNEQLFMAPLIARHRQMAVNVKRFDQQKLGYMLDEVAHPVWYPTEFFQILEEFMMDEEPAMDIWPAQMETCAAMEAMIQALFGGALTGPDGSCQADTPEIRSGLRWLSDAVDSGLVSYAQSREEALERFIAGETAIFPDWTPWEEERYAQVLAANGIQVKTVPYPSSIGLPVRAFEVTGICVFSSGDAQRDVLSIQAAAFLHEDAQIQTLLGQRGIWRDSAVWLPCLSADARGATLRSLLCTALRRVLEGESSAGQALERVQAAMDTLE